MGCYPFCKKRAVFHKHNANQKTDRFNGATLNGLKTTSVNSAWPANVNCKFWKIHDLKITWETVMLSEARLQNYPLESRHFCVDEWLLKSNCPHLLKRVCDSLCRVPTFPNWQNPLTFPVFFAIFPVFFFYVLFFYTENLIHVSKLYTVHLFKLKTWSMLANFTEFI